MHSLQTLKVLNDAAADNRARQAIRDIVTRRKEAEAKRKTKPPKKAYIR